MLVFSFIVGLVSGASLGIILVSLMIAGKKNDAMNCICPECKKNYSIKDDEEETIVQEITQC
jgi:hypothetical protein